MKAIRTFRFGGIDLLQRKISIELPVPNAFLPSDAVIPLRQHAGPSAKRIVETGDAIREGQLIGKAAGAGSANIHSPIPGVVREIRRIPDLLGGQVDAVCIAMEGSFERLGRKKELFPWKSLTKHQILRAIADKGVVDDDGPGIPIFERLHDPKGERPPCVLVVNCMESDPWNSSLAALLAERAESVLEGVDILKRILSPVRTLLASDGPTPEQLTPEFDPEAKDEDRIEILRFEQRYPQDLPSLLREAINGKKAGAEVIFVVSAFTVASIYDAVALNKPQVERYVTVSGDAVKSPGILRARIGTSIGDLLEECGGFESTPQSIILNGPFRGTAVADLKMPVLKTTRSVVALTAGETHRRSMTACIRCGRCALGCPARLDPSRLYKRIVRGDVSAAIREGLDECLECGVCAHLCPSRLPLVQAFSLIKRGRDRRGANARAEGRIA